MIPTTKILSFDWQFRFFTETVELALKREVWRHKSDPSLYFCIPKICYTKRFLRNPIFDRRFLEYCTKLRENAWEVKYDKDTFGGYNLLIRPKDL